MKSTYYDGTASTNVTNITSSPFILTVSPASTRTYTITALSNTTCSAQASDLTGSALITVNTACQVVSLTQPAQLNAVISGSTTICSGNAAAITVNLTGGTAPYQVTYNSVNYSGNSPITFNDSPTSTTTYDISNIGVTDANYCNSNITGSATVNVNQNGTLTLTSAPSTANQMLCDNTGLTNITYLVGGAATSASIVSGSLPSGVAGVFNAGVFTISGTPNVTGTYNYTVGVSGSVCNDPQLSGTITVNAAIGAAGTITGTATVCQGQTGAVYSVPAITNAENYTWALPPGASITSGINTGTITVSYTTTASSGNVNVYGSNSCGNGTISSNYAVTVNPLPAAAGSISGTATVCQGQTSVTYSVLTITNATGYTWSLPTGAAITAGTNTKSITVSYSTTATSGNVSVYGTNSCGNGVISNNYAVTVNPLPVAAGNITGTSTVCQGQTGVIYSVPLITNATGYTWALPSGGIITSGSNTNTITVSYTTTATSGNATVYGTNSCGNGTVSPAYSVTVNLLPAAAGAVTGTATVCQGQTGVIYKVNAITNATGYTWSVPAGAAITGGVNTGTITVSYSTTATSGNINVYGTNNICSGTVSPNYAVTVNPLPLAAGTITGTATVCQGQTGVTYSVPAITNATGYTWSLPTGATITAGTNTGTITVSYSTSASSGNVNVYGTNACGNGVVYFKLCSYRKHKTIRNNFYNSKYMQWHRT